MSSIGMSFPREKRENEEFYDEKFLTRKTRREKNEKLTTLTLRFLGIYEAHFKIFCLKSKISKKLSQKMQYIWYFISYHSMNDKK